MTYRDFPQLGGWQYTPNASRDFRHDLKILLS